MNPTVVCWLAELLPERPACVLADGSQIALVRLHDDRVCAVGMWDPVAKANVMGRGLVGSTVRDGEEVPLIYSPMHKQAYDLRTGVCLSDPEVNVGVWQVEVVDRQVVVGPCLVSPSSSASVLARAS